jgi:hypothetical protein
MNQLEKLQIKIDRLGYCLKVGNFCDISAGNNTINKYNVISYFNNKNPVVFSCNDIKELGEWIDEELQLIKDFKMVTGAL